jgi:hypothetical protein
MRTVAAALSTAARTPLQDADTAASTQPLQDAGADASYAGESDASVLTAAEEGGGGGGGGLHRDVTTNSAARMYIGEHTLRARTRIALTKAHAPPQH